MKKGLIVFFAMVFIGMALMYRSDIPIAEGRAKYGAGPSKYMDIDGMKVHYRDSGQGPALVLIHGTAASLHTWDGWVAELENEFRVIRMDTPGHGLTGPRVDNDDYSMPMYVDFIDKFVTKLGLDSFYLAGNSLGGGISWLYSLKHPQKVQKMILLDASAYPKDPPAIIGFAQIPGLGALMTMLNPRFLYEGNIKAVYYNDDLITDEIIDRYYALSLSAGNRPALRQRMISSATPYPFEDIKKIKTPTLIQWGKYDEWIPLEHGKRFHKEIAGSKLDVFEAGHIPMEELPKETAASARKFLLAEENKVAQL